MNLFLIFAAKKGTLMKKKSIFGSIMTVIIACALMLCMTACRQKSSSEGGKQLSAEEYAKKMSQVTADSVATQSEEVVEDSVLFTYAMAMEMIQPGYKCDEKFIASVFGDLNLPMQLAEQYISDADWGGDSPAISYCWGNGVKYENYKFTATSDKYFGVHFNFFFDESRKTGRITHFNIITSSNEWYDKFSQALKNDGMRYLSNVDPAVYGKKGKQYQRDAEPNEHTTEQPFYYVYDFSVNGQYDVEIGYDSGMDI